MSESSEVAQRHIARRCFKDADQSAFAELSGDRNPMHLDPIAARRTQAGAQVVHGIHMLLWSLDAWVASEMALSPIAELKIRFDKMVYVGDTVDIVRTHLDSISVNIELRVNGLSVSQIVASFGAPSPSCSIENETPPILPVAPAILTLEDIPSQFGCVAFASSREQIAAYFPALAFFMGTAWVQSVLATTTLVGMVCPGLHSIFGGLTVQTVQESAHLKGLSFRVTKVHPRFRVVRMEIAGPRLVGRVESFVRHPPTVQASIADLDQLVARNEFAGATALIVGGSRGLGELTAKLLAAGGARVIVTYHLGETDAQALAESIRAGGGLCELMAYDVTKPAAGQLSTLPTLPSHIYYFATPAIFRSKVEVFVAERFAEFQQFYVEAFYDLFKTMRAKVVGQLTAFYPSSVAVEARPPDMTEYSMAKAAGEILCADLQRFLSNSRIVVSRLPRLPTDQTATLLPADVVDPVTVMLPIVRDIQSDFNVRS